MDVLNYEIFLLRIYIYTCDFLELLMCAMSVQDILAGRSDGGMKLNPMYQLWKLRLNLMKDENLIFFILFVL